MKILVIDDDVDKRECIVDVLDMIFKDTDYLYAITWQKGISKAIEFRDTIDLIILDMQFPRRLGDRVSPDMGITTLKDLAKRKIDIPVVVFSSEDQTYDLKKNNLNVPCVVYGQGDYYLKIDLIDALKCYNFNFNNYEYVDRGSYISDLLFTPDIPSIGLEVTDGNLKSLQHDKTLDKILSLGSYYRLPMSNEKKHYKITKKELLNTHKEIGEIFGHYAANVIKIKGNYLWYLHGYENFMNWDSIDIRKYKKLLKKYRRNK